jgi:DNA-3-methyladenine glycosylase II
MFDRAETAIRNAPAGRGHIPAGTPPESRLVSPSGRVHPAGRSMEARCDLNLVSGVGDELTPAEARWENEGGAPEDGETFDLYRRAFLIDPLPPFRLDLSVWALRRRPRNAVDAWDGRYYRRTLSLSGATFDVLIASVEGRRDPRLCVILTGKGGQPREDEVRASVERLLGIRVDLSDFYRMAESDDLIGSMAARLRGLKPPRFPTVFEALVNAVACQQLSLESGLTILNRLAATFGETGSPTMPPRHAFPAADRIACLRPSALRDLGFSIRKAGTIIDIASAVVAGELDLEGLEHASDTEAVSLLTSLGGIGRWSAEYVLLRGLGRLNVFPGDDVGARNNLAGRLGLRAPLDYEAVGNAVSRWQPYAGLVYFHLLVDRLEATGVIAAAQGA